MQTSNNKTIKAVLAGMVLLSLQACSTGPQPSEMDVAEAYHSPDIVAVSPYTRTIFSSHNF